MGHPHPMWWRLPLSQSLPAVLAIVVLALPAAALAQPLAGDFTIDNTRPTDGTNFHDFGDAFDALEENGIEGDVVFTVFGLGGPYQSNEAYGLGATDNPTFLGDLIGVPGTLDGSITFRAHEGHRVIIEGDGVQLWFGSPDGGFGALLIAARNVTLEGLEVRNATSFGILGLSGVTNSIVNLTIRKCRVHSISAGPGIAMFNEPVGHPTGILIENNLVWNCGGDQSLGENTYGLIGLNNVTATLRHNTLLATPALAPVVPLVSISGNHVFDITAHFENNILIAQRAGAAMLNLPSMQVEYGRFDGNVYFWDTDEPGPFATGHQQTSEFEDWVDFGEVRFETLAEWQALEHDQNSQVIDPRLVDIHSDPPDLRLRADSPVIDMGVATDLHEDIDGHPRPQGAGPDPGAHEFPSAKLPSIEIRHVDDEAQAIRIIAPNATFVLPRVLEPNERVVVPFEIHNVGTARLRIRHVDVLDAHDAKVRLLDVPVKIAPGDFDVLLVEITAKAGDWRFDLKVANDSPHRDPYRFTVRSLEPVDDGDDKPKADEEGEDGEDGASPAISVPGQPGADGCGAVGSRGGGSHAGIVVLTLLALALAVTARRRRHVPVPAAAA